MNPAPLLVLPSLHSSKVHNYVRATAVTAIKPITRSNSFGITHNIGADVFVDGSVGPVSTSLSAAAVADLVDNNTTVKLAASA